MTRIVGGELGGRRLEVPRGRGTRPTSERVREALFSTLESLRGTVVGAAFLDLYAGSGAVGLEAASRGASPVVLVEHDPRAVAVIRRNIDALATDVEVLTASVARVLAGPAPHAFDIVFVDPPYDDDVDPVLARLAADEWLRPGGIVVVERATRGSEPIWPPPLAPDRSRRYGDSVLWYGRRP